MLMLLLPSLSFASTVHYVDCSASSNGIGTFGKPFNSLRAVNTAKSKFAAGDDLYFKVGTTCTLTSDADRLQVTWSGVNEANRTIIGAYYGNGLFGLGGNARPIISGANNSYPGQEQGAVDVRNRTYVTVRDLNFQYCGRTGATAAKAIDVRDSSYINIENNNIYRAYDTGILFAKVNTGNILYNQVSEVGYPIFPKGGAAIEVTAANSASATKNIRVAYNHVSGSKNEGIGLYKKVTNSIVEYNVVRDIKSFYIYIDAGQYNIIRYNLVYNSTYSPHSCFPARSHGISLVNEDQRKYLFMGYNEVYGNLIAGVRHGINLGCEIVKTIPSAFCFPGDKIYNNTIIDADTSIMIWDPSSSNNLEIKNNLSWIVTEGIGSRHIATGSPAGVTWSNNLFYGGPKVTGNAANAMVNKNPRLAKKSGWRSLRADSLKGNEFSPDSDSPAIGVGLPIEGYTRRIANADYSATPINLTTKVYSPGSLSVGAWMPLSINNIDNRPQPPPNVKIKTITTILEQSR
jgi:hypothetical protein